MVVPLGPGKFYGSSLPRPRIYTDPKLNPERVDPPVPVMDPLLSWAEEAHWSMGGLSFKRLRLQGRIEGSVKKLRAEREKLIKKRKKMNAKSPGIESAANGSKKKTEDRSKRAGSESPPPAPIATKKRRYLALSDEGDESSEDEIVERENVGSKRRLARKLWDDFDRVADENKRENGSSITVASRTRSRGSERDGAGIGGDVMKVVEEVNRSYSKGKKLKGKSVSESSPVGGSVRVTRTSPRLAKRN